MPAIVIMGSGNLTPLVEVGTQPASGPRLKMRGAGCYKIVIGCCYWPTPLQVNLMGWGAIFHQAGGRVLVYDKPKKRK